MQRRDFLKTGAAASAGIALSGSNAGSGEWEAYARSALSNPEAVKQKILDEAHKVYGRNLVKSRLGEFHIPSSLSYTRFYAWDAGWHVIAQSAFDLPAAINELEAIFNGLQIPETGMVAHEALVPEFVKAADPTFSRLGNNYFDANGRCRIIDPPSFLVAAEVLYNKTRDQRVLALLPRMEKCLEYLLGPRDLFKDGLVAIIHPWESGTDATPAYDQATGLKISNPFNVMKIGATHNRIISDAMAQGWDLQKIAARNVFVFEDVCMNGLTLAGVVSVARLFQAAGRPDKARKWNEAAARLMQSINNVCWDEGRGYYFPRWDFQSPRQSSRVSIAGVIPLISGLVDKARADRVLDNYLLSPEQFRGPWLAPFNSISEMRREFTLYVRGLLWRGPCIWINMNWMAARAASVCGRPDLARKITQATAALVCKSGFREYYDPDTGGGMGAKIFTWPALVLDMIQEHGL